MTLTLRICGLCLVSGLLLATGQAYGERLRSATAEPAADHLSTPALKYFGKGKHTPLPRSRPRRQAPPTERFQLAGGKPFQNVNKGPTVTPYLQLDTIESSGGVPNYYSRVLPQLQQQQAIQAQAAELRQLQQRIRANYGGGVISNNRNGGVPTTGHSAQFLNNGGYFPPISRK